MPRTGACSEVTALNLRLAVRQAVADFCADPKRTVEKIVNGRYDNSTELIHRLVAARLESVYEQIQYSVLSSSNGPPSSESFLRFLSKTSDEPEKDIVRRFEQRNTLARRQNLEEWQKVGLPRLTPIYPAPIPATVPRLDGLTSDRSIRSRTNSKHRKMSKNGREPKSFPYSESPTSMSSTSTDQVWSKSASDSVDAGKSDRQKSGPKNEERILPEAKSSTHSPNHRTQQLPNYAKNSDVNRTVFNERVLAQIRKAAEDAVPAVLEKEFIPTAPSMEERATNTTPVKSKMPMSSCSSLRSDDDRGTVRFVPAKVPTTDVAISTDPIMEQNHSKPTVEVGVNTTTEIVEGSSSSNTASDNSAGQLPRRLFDTILQRPSLRIVSLRPDGSIVVTNTPKPRSLPCVREWTSIQNEEDAQKSVVHSDAEIREVADEASPCYPEDNDEAGLESVSASSSRPDRSEEDLNTMANISPLPHF